jgi:hypothetical protein
MNHKNIFIDGHEYAECCVPHFDGHACKECPVCEEFVPYPYDSECVEKRREKNTLGIWGSFLEMVYLNGNRRDGDDEPIGIMSRL